MVKIQASQISNYQDITNSFKLETERYLQIYTDFLCSTSTVVCYLNGVINTSLGGGVDSGGHPGQCILTTGTSASGEGRISPQSFSVIALDNQAIKFETCVQLPVLSTFAQEYEVSVGIINQSKDANQGIYFYYDFVGGGVNWLCRTRTATDTITQIDSNVTVTANAWYRLTLVYFSQNLVLFYINGSLVATISTTIPNNTTQLAPVVAIAKWVGTTARLFNVDYYYLLAKVTR